MRLHVQPYLFCHLQLESCGKEGFADSTSSGPIDEKLPSVAKEDEEEEEPQRIARPTLTCWSLVVKDVARTLVSTMDVVAAEYVAFESDVNDGLRAEELVAVWWMKV